MIRQMKTQTIGLAFLATLATALGCGEPAPDFRPLVLADGTVTVNDRCAVRMTPLNPAIEPLWVNDHPVGFC